MKDIKELFTRVKTEDRGLGTVESNLSTQITVNYDDGTFGFLLKKDHKVDWEIVDELRSSPRMLRRRRVHRP